MQWRQRSYRRISRPNLWKEMPQVHRGASWVITDSLYLLQAIGRIQILLHNGVSFEAKVAAKQLVSIGYHTHRCIRVILGFWLVQILFIVPAWRRLPYDIQQQLQRRVYDTDAAPILASACITDVSRSSDWCVYPAFSRVAEEARQLQLLWNIRSGSALLAEY